MLKKCGREDCNPVEQLRGEMGPGDYKDVEVNNGPDFKFPGPLHKTVDHYKTVELHDGNRNDVRVCCLTCGEALAWKPRDLPGMPGAGSDWVRKEWNASH